MPRDKEFYALLYGVQSKNIVGHKCRGYILFNGMYDKTRKIAVSEWGKIIEKFPRTIFIGPLDSCLMLDVQRAK